MTSEISKTSSLPSSGLSHGILGYLVPQKADGRAALVEVGMRLCLFPPFLSLHLSLPKVGGHWGTSVELWGFVKYGLKATDLFKNSYFTHEKNETQRCCKLLIWNSNWDLLVSTPLLLCCVVLFLFYLNEDLFVLCPIPSDRQLYLEKQSHKLIYNWTFLANSSLVNCCYQGVFVKIPGGNRWRTQIGIIPGGLIKVLFTQMCAVCRETTRDSSVKAIPTPRPGRRKGRSRLSRGTRNPPEEQLWPLAKGPRQSKVTFQEWSYNNSYNNTLTILSSSDLCWGSSLVELVDLIQIASYFSSKNGFIWDQ